MTDCSVVNNRGQVSTQASYDCAAASCPAIPGWPGASGSWRVVVAAAAVETNVLAASSEVPVSSPATG